MAVVVEKVKFDKNPEKSGDTASPAQLWAWGNILSVLAENCKVQVHMLLLPGLY
jgi:hypothetical protein